MASVSPLTIAEKPRTIATIVEAFAVDPVERWLWPGDDAYAASFPSFVEAFGGAALGQGSAWGIDGEAAVALWLAPGSESDEDALVDVLLQSVAGGKHDALLSTLEQMAAAHPRYPHWYLPWLAVGPSHQGRGLGGQLLAQGLTIVDAEGLPAFLETPNPRTVPLYERHGFEVVATTQGSCPPMTSMLRPAA